MVSLLPLADIVPLIASSELTFLLPTAGCWRSTQTAAIAAVEESRQVRRAEGEEIAENAEWGPVDYVEATKARMPLLKGAIFVFKSGISKLNRLIWNRQDEPEMRESTEAVAAMLRAAPRRVGHLLDSAVRAGAQAALMLVRSWYPGLDLDLLTAMRAGSGADLESVWPAICHRSAMIGANINPLEYTPYLDPEGQPMETPTYSTLIYSTTSSSDNGAGAEDTGAKPGGSHQTASSSGDYEMSEQDAEGSASSAQPEGQDAARRDDGASTSQPGGQAGACQGEDAGTAQPGGQTAARQEEDAGTAQPGSAEEPPAPQAEPETSAVPPPSA